MDYLAAIEKIQAQRDLELINIGQFAKLKKMDRKKINRSLSRKARLDDEKTISNKDFVKEYREWQKLQK